MTTDYTPAQKWFAESFGGNESNIRRRIYDALGVLVGVKMVAQSKKEYHWLGRPTALGHGLVKAKAEKLALIARMEEQADHLQVRFHVTTADLCSVCKVTKFVLVWQELLKTHTALHNLIQRNKHVVADDIQYPAHSCSLQLPFNLIQVWLLTSSTRLRAVLKISC